MPAVRFPVGHGTGTGPGTRNLIVDIRAQQARENHRLASECDADAALHRRRRDEFVRQLRAEDPGEWSYGALAAAVGCSKELIAYVCRAPAGSGQFHED